MKGKKYYEAPYKMVPTPVFCGEDQIGYVAGIIDADGYIAGTGLMNKIYETPEAVTKAWGQRPLEYAYSPRDAEWRDWCGSYYAPTDFAEVEAGPRA